MEQIAHCSVLEVPAKVRDVGFLEVSPGVRELLGRGEQRLQRGGLLGAEGSQCQGHAEGAAGPTGRGGPMLVAGPGHTGGVQRLRPACLLERIPPERERPN